MLIERSSFLASLEGLLSEALGGSGRLVFLGGEAGVGKTTLAAALAGAGAGPAVRRGCCDSVTTAEALGPILDALPELAEAIDGADGVSRLRLFCQVRDALAASPMLLLLEDVHWAAREVAASASVLGRRAGADLLAAMSGQPLAAVDECLERGVLVLAQLTRARDRGLEALAIYQQERDARLVGRSQRWLSRLSWVLGQNADGARYAAAAVDTLEALGPGPELAMAYSNLAQLRMLAGDAKAAVRLGNAAIELARQVADRETEIHALNNVGTALASGGRLMEGWSRLTQSLDLALAADAHEHVARAFTNLGVTYVLNWSLGEAGRHLKAGITYCAERDLDTWHWYMTAWLARSLAGQGQYAMAERHLADVLRHPQVSPITRVSALPVAGVLAARRGRDGTGALDEALEIAVQMGESQRLVPVAAARAEAAWLAGRPGDLVAEIDRAWTAAAAYPQPWELGGLSWWLHLAGERQPVRRPVARPFALMLAGEHRAAAAEWEGLGCPLWSAYALAFSPPLKDAQRCLDLLGPLDVPAVRHAVLRDRRARGLAVPRGPRPARRASPAGLTARETEVLQLLADGLSYAEVAERLVLSEKTVGHHVSSVLRKLGEPTRSRAVATAQRLGVIPPR